MEIGIVGAGAVVENFHLPAARLCRDLRVVAIADPNLERARRLSARFGVPKAVADYRELDGLADGLLIAAPNALHASVSVSVLSRGVPVLVEKPMALGVTEANEMIRAASVGRTVLAVALVGRHASGARWIKRAVAEGSLGPLKNVEIEYGSVFSWKPASSFIFRKEQAGGGVLIDVGSHMLDLAIWWLGTPELIEYRDDAMGGVEAECLARLLFPGPTAPVTCAVSLSRIRNLSNTIRIKGERRIVEWDIATDTVRVRSAAGQEEPGLAGLPYPQPRSLHELFAEQLQTFARAVSGQGEPMASGESALPVVDLIERCYKERGDIEFPWGSRAS